MHHPAPTYTNAFVTRHGENAVNDVQPAFVENSTINRSWASLVILSAVPTTAKCLRLSMANLDTLNSFATVNRLLSYGYRKLNYEALHLDSITMLTLDLHGKGTHGDRDWPGGDTGSAGMLKHWRRVLTSMEFLTRLDLRFDIYDESPRYTDAVESDLKGCILNWLLSDITLAPVQTLCLRYFLLDGDSISKIFASSSNWPSLTSLVFDEIRLMMNDENEEAGRESNGPNHLVHLQGESWLKTCQHISKTISGVKIEVIRPLSNINDQRDYKIHRSYVEQTAQLPNVKLDLGGVPKIASLPPLDQFPTSTKTWTEEVVANAR